MIRRILYLFLILFLLVPATHAAWTLTATSLPMELDSNSYTVIRAKLLNGTTPIDEETCIPGPITIKYQYGSTLGFLNSIGNGIWVAEHSPTDLPATITITATGDCGVASDVTTFLNLPANGGLSAPQGSSKVLLVNVSNSSGVVSGATVLYRIYNLSGSSQAIMEGTFSEFGEFYNATMELPTELGNYSYEVTATAPIGTGVTGGDGRLFHTVETISGPVSINGTENKCATSNGIITSCELNSMLSFEFEEEVGVPDNVWVEIWGTDLIEKVNLSNVTEGSQRYWRGTYSLPEDYNLSKTKESQNNELTLKVIANDEFENYTLLTSNVNLVTYWTIPYSKYSTRPGEVLDISFEVVKPYSGDHLRMGDLEGFNVSVFYITDSGTKTSVKNYTLSQMTYDNDLFHLQHTVQEDTLEGTYGYQWTILNAFGQKSSDSLTYKEFSVISQTQSGPVIINRSVISNSFEESGIFYEILNFNNTDLSRVIVRPIVLGSISEIVFGDFVLDENNASEDSKYIIESNTSKEFIIGYNITNNLSENYDGTLVIRVFSDLQGSIEKYRTEIPLETQIGGKTTNGTLQVNVNKIERNFIDSGTYVQNITVFNRGSETINVSISAEGTIKQINSISPTELTIAAGDVCYACFTQTVYVTDK